jgi:multidrug efflux pump subunit AcrA (membrane-fusion protein)
MTYRNAAALPAALLMLAAVACSGEHAEPPPAEAPANPEIGTALYGNWDAQPATPSPARRAGKAVDPIVVPDCRLTVIRKQEVPSQREGVLLFIGTEVAPGEAVPADRQVKIQRDGREKVYRLLKEDDRIEAGQLLAQLDDRLARDDWAIKTGKVAASRADLASAEKTRDEAKARYETQVRLLANRSTATEEMRAAKLTWDRYSYESDSKREAVRLAGLERHQAETVVGMHQIRSSIPGVIKAIYKKRGEAVKNLEPVFQVHDLSRLRAEGLVEVEYLPRLRKGMRAVLEPSRPEGPEQTFAGHLQEVTGVAVGGLPGKPIIVSAGEDGSVRLWERSLRHERRALRHPVPVRAVA